MKTVIVCKIAAKYWSEVKFLDKEEIFGLYEDLFRSGYMEEAFAGSFWLPKMVGQIVPSDLAVFKVWIERYVENWAKCDTFCNHTVGGLLEEHPGSVSEVASWAESGNRWLKRAAVVSLIVPAKKGKFLKKAFELSDTLLSDEDDIVKKGYGWLLKEASRKHPKDVYDYVMKKQDENAANRITIHD